MLSLQYYLEHPERFRLTDRLKREFKIKDLMNADLKKRLDAGEVYVVPEGLGGDNFLLCNTKYLLKALQLDVVKTYLSQLTIYYCERLDKNINFTKAKNIAEFNKWVKYIDERAFEPATGKYYKIATDKDWLVARTADEDPFDLTIDCNREIQYYVMHNTSDENVKFMLNMTNTSDSKFYKV